MFKVLLVSSFLLLGWTIKNPDPITPHELGDGNQTSTYEDAIDYYKKLAKMYPEVSIREYGITDIGKPLHLVIVSKDRIFNPDKAAEENKRIILINNGIHPGEPEGIDASMMLSRDLLQIKRLTSYLDNVIVLIIPIYNIGGALNRGCCSRANQNGPEEYGFRGNAKNLDLNRDFIKCDSENARTFTRIFHEWNPDVFVDTHTSNGADYPYVMTYISTQKDKLNKHLSEYLENEMLPFMNEDMKSKKNEMIPYVQPYRQTPDSGIIAFLETPRYASGYTTLFNTIGFITETHMFKPFNERVKATYDFLVTTIKVVNKDFEKIAIARAAAMEDCATKTSFGLVWKFNPEEYKTIKFKGYAAVRKPSAVTGTERLTYDRSKPWTKEIPFYNSYKVVKAVDKPYAYIIPQAYANVVDLLFINNVDIDVLAGDMKLEVEVYILDQYKTSKRPYESHYPHSNTSVLKEIRTVTFNEGDFVIFTDQVTNRYIIECLEPEATDSYFNWNFFDNVLQQKEWYSSYAFEEIAADLLKTDAKLRQEFEEKKASDAEFADSPSAQLLFIYRHSDYYENSHNLYPVGRVLEDIEISVR